MKNTIIMTSIILILFSFVHKENIIELSEINETNHIDTLKTENYNQIVKYQNGIIVSMDIIRIKKKNKQIEGDFIQNQHLTFDTKGSLDTFNMIHGLKWVEKNDIKYGMIQNSKIILDSLGRFTDVKIMCDFESKYEYPK